MNEREAWEFAGKFVAAILLLAVAFVLLFATGDKDEPQPDLPLVSASNPLPCGPPPGAPPLLTKPEKYHRINDRPKDGGIA